MRHVPKQALKKGFSFTTKFNPTKNLSGFHPGVKPMKLFLYLRYLASKKKHGTLKNEG